MVVGIPLACYNSYYVEQPQTKIKSNVMKAKNIGVFIPGLNAKNITNRGSEGAIEKKLNTEKVSTASPAVPEARTTLEESAASEISTTFHPEKVSIIMPTFNAKDTIGEAIESALNGTHQNLEILVIPILQSYATVAKADKM